VATMHVAARARESKKGGWNCPPSRIARLPRLRADCATKQRIVAQAPGGIHPRPDDIVQALMCVAFRDGGPPSMLKSWDAQRMLAENIAMCGALPPRTEGI